MEPGAQLYTVAGARAQLQGLSLGPERRLQHLRKGEASGWSGSGSGWAGVGASRTRHLFDRNPTALSPRGFPPESLAGRKRSSQRKLAGENTRTESLALPAASPCLVRYTPDTQTHVHRVLSLTHIHTINRQRSGTHTVTRHAPDQVGRWKPRTCSDTRSHVDQATNNIL